MRRESHPRLETRLSSLKRVGATCKLHFFGLVIGCGKKLKIMQKFGHIMRKHALIMRKFKHFMKLISRPVRCIYMLMVQIRTRNCNH